MNSDFVTACGFLILAGAQQAQGKFWLAVAASVCCAMNMYLGMHR